MFAGDFFVVFVKHHCLIKVNQINERRGWKGVDSLNYWIIDVLGIEFQNLCSKSGSFFKISQFFYLKTELISNFK